jgi:DNA-binding MarR family transcriptional regulator
MSDDVQWLTPAEQHAWRRLAAVTTLLPAELDTQLHRDAGLSHYAYFVLAMLSEAPQHTLRMSELAGRAVGSASRLSHLVTRLEAQGLVRREKACDDGRGQLAILTEEGLAKISCTAPGHVAEVRRVVFDALTAEQVEQLDAICQSLLGQLDPDGTLTPPMGVHD